MAARKIPKEVQAIFQRYQENHIRRLKKEDAIKMMKTEFNLDDHQAEQMFITFDKDGNGIMSLWEFQQFYQIVGGAAAEIAKKFEELDKDGSGMLDADEARAGLHAMTVEGGRALEEREIDFFIRTTVGDDNQIDLGHFANLLFRLKLHKGPQKK